MNTPDNRTKIIHSAVATFLEHGLVNTSFNAVIRASGVSKGGVYHYFASKDELIIAIYDHFYQKYATGSKEEISAHNRAWDILKRTVDQYDVISKQLKPYSKLLTEFFFYAACVSDEVKAKSAVYYLDYLGYITELIEHAQRDGDIRPDIDARSTAAGLMGVSDGIECVAMLLTPDQLDATQAIACTHRHILNAIAARL